MFSKLVRSSSSTVQAACRRQVRSFSLKARMDEIVPQVRAEFVELKKKYAGVELGQTTVGAAIGGMRGINGLICDTSEVDPESGIRIRGLSIPEMQAKLPIPAGATENYAEATLWLLMTGEVPTQEQTESLVAELKARSTVDTNILNHVDSLPRNMHPMTQLCSSVLAMQPESVFAKAYAEKTFSKANAWEFALEDSLNLIARLPIVTARIFRNRYFNGEHIAPDASLDWAANYATMLGVSDSPTFLDLMRLYMNIHSDHEGGNVSAHATHLVGSALSDPYLSYTAGMAGLAGPLHGLANQEVLLWLQNFKAGLGKGDSWTRDDIKEACWKTLNSGQVIPGYGHAVLRFTDPRYTSQREFALKNLKDDPMFRLVNDLYEVVPGILTEHGKTKNPYPNVDAHSGVLLQHYNLVQAEYYTVLFGVSRAMGVLSNLVLSRTLGLPIERPKSMTFEWIRKNC